MHPLFHPMFIDYCVYFNGNHDYFECHEILEHYWKEIGAPRRHPLVGYIQLATAMYHWRRLNISGAQKLMKNALNIIIEHKQSIYFDYIDYEKLKKDCEKSMALIHQQEPFQSFQLSITNFELTAEVSKKKQELPKVDEEFLLHKHMLRDRTDILRAIEEKRKIRCKLKKKRLN